MFGTASDWCSHLTGFGALHNTFYLFLTDFGTVVRHEQVARRIMNPWASKYQSKQKKLFNCFL